MKMFYPAFIDSLLSVNNICWFGHLSLKNIKWPGCAFGLLVLASIIFNSYMRRSLSQRLCPLCSTFFSPLHAEFQLRPLMCRSPQVEQPTYRFSFAATAIAALSKH